MFTNFEGARQTQHIPTCLFNIDGFQEIERSGVKFGELRAEYISMHMKKGALCLSPNNQKVQINPELPINKCWILSLGLDGTAVVTYYWLLTRPDLVPAFVEPRTLGELVGFLSDEWLNRIFA